MSRHLHDTSPRTRATRCGRHAGRWLAMAAGLLLLTGCGHVSRQAFPHHYALSSQAPTATTRASGPTAEPPTKTLQLAAISAPSWLQGTDLYYRLDYRHDDRIAAYAHSDWVAPPARMLEPMIQDALATSGRWQAVTGPSSSTVADLGLHIRLNDFTQVFASRHDSHGVLTATVTLVDDASHHVLAQKHFRIQTPAPTADGPGGARALNHASRRFTSQLQQWLRGVTHAPASGGQGSNSTR